MCILLTIVSCLAFCVAIFIKALMNCTGFILNFPISFLQLLISFSLLTKLRIYSHHITLSGYMELNLGPKRGINQCFSVCHWNLNSTTSHNISKTQSLKVVSCKLLLVCFFSLKEHTYETRKNIIYFTSKALFVLEKIKV